jgi:glutamyl-tRNA(Gln) amidotransferase subunit D
MLTTDYRKRNPANRLELKPSFDDKVALIKFHPGIDSSLIDWHVEKRYKGIVLEGTGLGHVGKRLYDALKNAVKNDVVVGMASQCVWGRIDMYVYDSGRDLLSLGVIPLEDMLAETALVKLMWIFGQTQSVDETKRLLIMNIAGEFSPRTLPESEPC